MDIVTEALTRICQDDETHQFEQTDAHMEVVSLMAKLRPREKALIRMIYLEEKSFEEVASEFGIDISCLRYLVKRTLDEMSIIR